VVAVMLEFAMVVADEGDSCVKKEESVAAE
jgi:hypothetical protein